MDWWWERLPRSLGGAAPSAHLVLTDGSYVRAFAAGSWAPAAAFVVGLVLGWRPWEDAYATFSYSVVLTAALVVIGVLGASFGLAAWVGWCLGDALLATKPFGELSGTGRLVVDLLLAVAMVALPIVAQGLRSRTEQVLAPVIGQGAEWIGWAAFAVTAGVGAYVWQLSVPQLVRPLWVFNNLSPELPAIEPFQKDIGMTTSFEGVGFMDGLTSSSLFLWVLLAGVARAVLTTVAVNRDPVAALPPSPPSPGEATRPLPGNVRQGVRQSLAGGQLPPLAMVTEGIPQGAAAPPGPWADVGMAVLKAGLSALAVAAVLAGLTTTTEPKFATSQWLGMFAAFAVAALVRTVGLGFLPGYVRLVNRVPVVLRILACGLVAQTIANDLIEDALLANDTDFSSLLMPMLISVGIAAALIPGRRPTEIATAGAPV